MQHPPEIEAFCRDVRFLLRPNNPRGRSLFGAVRRTLLQYKLEGYYEPEDILSEAYLRALKYLNRSNQSIENPRAWLRTTSVNIIRERSRSVRKLMPLRSIDIDNIPAESQVSDEAILDNIRAAEQALQSLTDYDQLILKLRGPRGFSWEEVSQELQQQGYKKQTDGCLRKQGERAMKRLRVAFHKIRPS